MLKKILSIKPIDVRLIWRLESVLGQADIDLDNKSLTATLRPLIALFKTASKEQTDKNYQPKKTDKRLTLFAGSLSQAYLQSAAINFVRANPGQRSS